MNFRKTSEGGGGVISDPKNYVALFSVKEKRNGHRFPGKSATLFSKNRVRGGVRGRLEVFRKFIEFGPGRSPLFPLHIQCILYIYMGHICCLKTLQSGETEIILLFNKRVANKVSVHQNTSGERLKLRAVWWPPLPGDLTL